MTFAQRVENYMQRVLLPKVTDNALGGNVIATRLIANAKPGRSTYVEKAIKYKKSGFFTSFAGLDTFQATPFDTKVKLTYDMRGVRLPIGLSGMEIVASLTAGDLAATNMIESAVEEAEMELVDGLGDVAYGDGSGNSNKDPLGLGAIVDDGTNVPTIGGQSRTTYVVLKAKVTNLSDGTLSMNKLSTLHSDVSSGTGMTTPTLGVCDETTWDLYEQLLAPQVQHSYSETGYYTVTANQRNLGRNQGLVGHGGFVAVTFKGIPVVKDEKATANQFHLLNENWIEWRGWDVKGAAGYKAIQYNVTQFESTYAEAPVSNFTGFAWSGFRAPTNQFGSVADMILLGNQVSWQPKRQGKLTNVTQV